MHLLSTSKEVVVPFLRELAGVGFIALGFDAFQHGERATDPSERIRERVFGGFRRHMWPILGQTTLDAMRVIDWALIELGAGPKVVAGGVSMGGDVAVALAGADARVSRIAALVSTPDWTRPGMRELADPSCVLPQGEADAYARWFYDHLDPMTHLDAYARGPAIAFECAAEDTRTRRRGATLPCCPERGVPARGRVRVRVSVHPSVGHMDGARSEALLGRCLKWLSEGA